MDQVAVNDAKTPQQVLNIRYRMARDLWQAVTGVREAAALIGMGEREFCDRYVCHCWESSATGGETKPDCDVAFASAGDQS